MLRGRAIAEGMARFDVGEGGAGETGRAKFDETGEFTLTVRAGEAGRPGFETPTREGLTGLWVLPGRAGEAGRGMPAVNLATGGSAARFPVLPGLLGPATRRRRSSSCVLSFGDKGPTSDHTFSPTKVYTSLKTSV
jgi:hypothetical protein